MNQIRTPDTEAAFPELTEALNAAQAAFHADPNPDADARRGRLLRLEEALLLHADALVDAMDQDFSHRSRAESGTFDVTIPLGDIRMNRRKLKSWMKPRRYPMPMHLLPARGRVIPQPKGVVGVISPWNFPVYLSIAPVAAALAAGNRVMLKPSELTPRTSEVMAKMIRSEFSPDEISVHTGGSDLARAFSGLPFAHLLFTGSTEVGRHVAMAAARNLTPVTLELGGKSPAILGQHADLGRAAERIAFGKTANAGQVCVSPDYALVPRDKLADFSTAMQKQLRKFYPDFATSPDYSAIVSDRHLDRLRTMVAEAEARGVEVIRLGGGETGTERRLAPVLVIDPPTDLQLMQEEIFGPILPVIPYDDLDQARDFVTRRAAPLALYIFTEDRDERDSWLTDTLSGGACVNETLLHVAADTMPFGGVGDSGMGAYHGKAGFDTFSHLKSVLYQPKWNTGFVMNPPIKGFKKAVATTLRKMIR